LDSIKITCGDMMTLFNTNIIANIPRLYKTEKKHLPAGEGLELHVTPRPITTLIGREDAHKSWYSGRPLPKAILNGGLSYRARLVKV
jgi:hypothetical protein